MDILFLCIVIFLFVLAVFDLSVGVSNDAVNFLNSAIGSRAGSYKRVLIVAAAGVFLGAATSNGMMDIARHGMFHPEMFSFYDVLCIFLAVMVCDIILLDVFNTLGLPTSTTVSLVFDLLGAAFVVSLIKMAYSPVPLDFGDLLNTAKAMEVIMGIFCSVIIAFIFGTLVQFITRTLFSFQYKRHLKWGAGVFGGLCITAILYFLVLKGAKNLTFMTPEIKDYIKNNTWALVGYCFVATTVLMQLLHIMKVNVLKVIVLTGTFALAVAFSGNDLVNFIGVPLAGFSAFQDFTANGGGDATHFMMNSLNESASTNVWFLVGAGFVMVISLATSSKAKKVTETEIKLGTQGEGDEKFGSSRLARRIVRASINITNAIRAITPAKLRRWVDSRFVRDNADIEAGAAFDQLRGAINLVIAGMLIALGTSMKLPLSTTFVTFMVAMGTSLADRAWGRESAVFRITGVISVIGSWFITAAAAFIGAGVLAAIMHFGGEWVMIAFAVGTGFFLFHSNRRFKKQQEEEKGDNLYATILSTDNKEEVWRLFNIYVDREQQNFINFTSEMFEGVAQAFANDDVKALYKAEKLCAEYKYTLKNARRRETLILRRTSREIALEKSAWFHLSNNCCMSMLYNLRRITEICREHTDNNFRPLPAHYRQEFFEVTGRTVTLLNDTAAMLSTGDIEAANLLRREGEEVKQAISDTYHRLYEQLRTGDTSVMNVVYVYLNMLQETRELVSSLRKYVRAHAKMHDTDFTGRLDHAVSNRAQIS